MTAGGYGICEAKSGRAVFTSRDAPEFQSLLAQLERNQKELDRIKRFDMPDFIPNEHYLREMERFGILPADRDDSRHLNYYELDEQYWRSFWVIIRARA